MTAYFLDCGFLNVAPVGCEDSKTAFAKGCAQSLRECVTIWRCVRWNMDDFEHRTRSRLGFKDWLEGSKVHVSVRHCQAVRLTLAAWHEGLLWLCLNTPRRRWLLTSWKSVCVCVDHTVYVKSFLTTKGTAAEFCPGIIENLDRLPQNLDVFEDKSDQREGNAESKWTENSCRPQSLIALHGDCV